MVSSDNAGFNAINDRFPGERLAVGGHRFVDAFVGCAFTNCRFDIRGGLSSKPPLHLQDCVLSACEIRVLPGKKLPGDSFTNVAFEDCVFSGHFYCCEFGPVPRQRYVAGVGAVTNCAFDEAILDLCVFHDTDMATLRLPSWPHFAVRNAYANRADWKALKLPSSFQLAQELVGMRDEGTATWNIIHAPSVDPSTNLDELRQALDAKEYVRIE